MKIDWVDLTLAVVSVAVLLAGCLAIHYSVALISAGLIGLAWVVTSRSIARSNRNKDG